MNRTGSQFDFSFLQGGGEMGERTRNLDWSKTPLGTPDQWPPSLRTSVSILLNSQFPMFIWWGKELTTIYNDAYKIIAGEKHPALLGKSGKIGWSEIWDKLAPLVDHVFKGNATWSEDLLLHIERYGFVEEAYFTFSYSPVLSEAGAVGGLFCAVIETTEKVVGKKKLEESEARFRKMVEQAPVPIGLTRGSDMVFESINAPMLKSIHKTGNVLQKPLLDVLPELKGQLIERILHAVWDTGQAYQGYEVPVVLNVNGGPGMRYYNISYTPIFEAGTIRNIIHVAVEVTEQVVARKRIEEAEERARLSVEAAELGTFDVNLLAGEIITSPRLDAIFGIGHPAAYQRYIDAFHKDDLPLRELAFQNAFETGTLEYEVRIVWKDGSVHWVRTKGIVSFDAAQKPVKVLGVVQDVTEEKAFFDELEKQVRERTNELQIANRELERSNAHLEEFAHAASHDLKEPIRKIHFFTDRLKNQLADKLSPEDAKMFGRVEHASRRMNSLIDDLLLYSHVSQRPHEKEFVDLNEKLEGVQEDLELDIEEKGALITVDRLPVVKGYKRQLQQLFHNLLTNALKYSRPDSVPKISITTDKIRGSEAGLLPETDYYLITVSDNGIGFEQEQAEKIFQMFQRLHGKHEYEGTGVGLSIAKKVAENHNGKIVAKGKPGEGASFTVYLPVE